MILPVNTPLKPMEAQLVDEIPRGDAWQYEPKWDGFRCLVFRDGEDVQLQSKSGQPLGRYFPEIVNAVAHLKPQRFVLDGELVIDVGGTLSFEQLQLRLHPAESRVLKLAAAHPARFIAFDLLVDNRGRDLTDTPLSERRKRLEKFAGQYFADHKHLSLSPATTDSDAAQQWLDELGAGLDGVIAKRTDLSYRSGERTGMQKIKNMRTAECVIGGYRQASSSKAIGSLLLGLYDDAGLLHHVGFTSALNAKVRNEAERKLKQVQTKAGNEESAGFTGRAPGGPSRWSRGRSTEWIALPPQLVVEVKYDHFSGGRFRHGTRFLRWRPDKAPKQCTFDQLTVAGPSSLRLLDRA